MADVLDLNPALTATKPEGAPHRRIRLASRVLSILFGAIFIADILFALILAATFFVDIPGIVVSIGRSGMNLTIGAAGVPPGYQSVTSLPPLQGLAHLAMGLVVIPPSLMIFWNLRQLFRLYGRGVVFAEANARHIKRIGLWLVANAIAPLISVSVLSALGMVVDHKWFHGDTIPQLVLGGIVWVIAQVMEVGRQIEEEQEQFV